MTARTRIWLLAFVGFSLLIGAWSVATPYDGTPDEQDHILRAYGVTAGQVVAAPEKVVRGGGAYQTVPRSLVRDGSCWKFKPTVSAACATEPGGDRTLVRTGSGAGRYHPFYYGLVGWPLQLSPDWLGVLLARLISAALCAALLANALTDAMRWSRHRLMMVGVIAAATPMAVHMGGAINPSGVEIAAGIAFFAAAIPLLYNPDASRSRTLLWHAGVAALGLATLRAAGPLWLVVAVLALLVPLQWTRLASLWRWRPARWWSLGLVATMAVSAAWTLALKTTDMGDFTRGQTWTIKNAIQLEAERLRQYADEMVGVTSWLDTRIPGPAYLIWQYTTMALVIFAFVLAHRAGRWRLATLFAGGVGIPFAMQIAYVNKHGFITQGRYLLPVLVGLPLLAAFLIQEYGLAADRSRSLLRTCAVLLLPIHLVCLAYTMARWQQGLSADGRIVRFNPLAGTWHPLAGSGTALLMALAGVLLLAALLWFEPFRQRADAATPAEAGVATPERVGVGPV